MSEHDVKAIFASLHIDGEKPPSHLTFQIVPVGSNGLKLSPPSYEFEDGLYVLLRPAKKRKQGGSQPSAPAHLSHLLLASMPPETCPWSLSGPQFPAPNAVQQRYCYPKGRPEYSSRTGGALWTMYDENGNEDTEYRLLHVYLSPKRAANKGIDLSAEGRARSTRPTMSRPNHAPSSPMERKSYVVAARGKVLPLPAIKSNGVKSASSSPPLLPSEQEATHATATRQSTFVTASASRSFSSSPLSWESPLRNFCPDVQPPSSSSSRASSPFVSSPPDVHAMTRYQATTSQHHHHHHLYPHTPHHFYKYNYHYNYGQYHQHLQSNRTSDPVMQDRQVDITAAGCESGSTCSFGRSVGHFSESFHDPHQTSNYAILNDWDSSLPWATSRSGSFPSDSNQNDWDPTSQSIKDRTGHEEDCFDLKYSNMEFSIAQKMRNFEEVLRDSVKPLPEAEQTKLKKLVCQWAARMLHEFDYSEADCGPENEGDTASDRGIVNSGSPFISLDAPSDRSNEA